MNPRPAVPAVISAARALPARLRHGRPGILTARLTAALALAEIAFHSGAGSAPAASVLAGIVTCVVLTARGDLAPPPGQ